MGVSHTAYGPQRILARGLSSHDCIRAGKSGYLLLPHSTRSAIKQGDHARMEAYP